MKLHLSFNKILIYCFFVLSLFTVFSFNIESGHYLETFAAPKESSVSVPKQADIELSGNWFKQGLAAIFIAVIRVFALISAISVAIITWTLTPEFMRIITNPGIYTGWSTVRDFLNIFFIFFLIFSAFATVFQVSRYHIKSTWVMIVVMALLVNFSWPIARVMIDISNVTMYSFVGDNDPKNTSTLLSDLANETEFLKVVIGGVVEADTRSNTVKINVSDSANLYTSLFIGIIASFLFAITIGAIAFILVIRTIAFAIYLVFASVGFTLAAFPSTRSYASQWWSGFTKQLIIGPLIIFALLLSTSVLKALNEEGFQQQANSIGQQQGVVGTILTYLVAIMLIWASILAASKVGAEGAGMVVGKASAAAKWGGNKLKRGSIGGLKMTARGVDHGMAHLTNKAANSQNTRLQRLGKGLSTVRSAPDRAKNWSQSKSNAYSDALEESKAHGLATGGVGGDKNAITALQNKQVAKMKKGFKDDNTDAKTLADKLDTAGEVEARALMEALTEMKEGIDDGIIDKMVKSSQKINNPNVTRAVNKKAADTGNVHVLLKNQLMQPGANADNVYSDVLANMDAQTLAKQEKLFLGMKSDPTLGQLGLNVQRRLNDNHFKTEFLKQGGGNKTVRAARDGSYV